jgi:hypothetical protein
MRDAVVVGGSDATIRWTLWRLLVGVRRACEAARRVLTRRARRLVVERQLSAFDRAGDDDDSDDGS